MVQTTTTVAIMVMLNMAKRINTKKEKINMATVIKEINTETITSMETTTSTEIMTSTDTTTSMETMINTTLNHMDHHHMVRNTDQITTVQTTTTITIKHHHMVHTQHHTKLNIPSTFIYCYCYFYLFVFLISNSNKVFYY